MQRSFGYCEKLLPSQWSAGEPPPCWHGLRLHLACPSMALVVLRMLKVARRVMILLLKGPCLPLDRQNKSDYRVQSQLTS